MTADYQNAEHRRSPAWQKGMQLTAAVYHLTRAFSADERFGLTSQLRRAAVSIPSNIAEGKGRLTHGEMLHFLGMARGSALEVLTQLDIAEMLGETSPEHLHEARSLACEVIRMLNASIATLRQRRSRTSNV